MSDKASNFVKLLDEISDLKTLNDLNRALKERINTVKLYSECEAIKQTILNGGFYISASKDEHPLGDNIGVLALKYYIEMERRGFVMPREYVIGVHCDQDEWVDLLKFEYEPTVDDFEEYVDEYEGVGCGDLDIYRCKAYTYIFLYYDVHQKISNGKVKILTEDGKCDYYNAEDGCIKEFKKNEKFFVIPLKFYNNSN